MTSIATNTALNFLQRYDSNNNGLSRQELSQGAMQSYFTIMSNMVQGNRQGAMNSFQDLMFATQAMQNFDSMASATSNMMPDNRNTISGFDILRTAMNDGNIYNLSGQDFAGNKPIFCGPQPNNGSPIFCGPQPNNVPPINVWEPQPNSPYQTQMPSNCMPQGNQPIFNSNSYYNQLDAMFNGGNVNNNYTTNNYYQQPLAEQPNVFGQLLALPVTLNGALLEGAGGLLEGLGSGLNGVGDWIQGGFNKAGDFLGNVPLIGGVLEAGTKFAGALTAAPLKIAGGISEAVGGVVKGAGKAVSKVAKAISKL